MRQLFSLVLFWGITIRAISQSLPFIITAPAGDGYIKIDKNGKTIIPNGRIITPVGKVYQVAPHPYGLTISLDGTVAVTANSGTNPISVSILKNILSDNPEIKQIPPAAKTDKGVLESVLWVLPFLLIIRLFMQQADSPIKFILLMQIQVNQKERLIVVLKIPPIIICTDILAIWS